MERGREKGLCESGGDGKGGGEMGDDWEGCCSENRIRWWLTPIPRRRSLTRAMTTAKSPLGRDEDGRRVRAESAADWVCASTRGRLVSTPLNRGTVLAALLLSVSLKQW